MSIWQLARIVCLFRLDRIKKRKSDQAGLGSHAHHASLSLYFIFETRQPAGQQPCPCAPWPSILRLNFTVNLRNSTFRAPSTSRAPVLGSSFRECCLPSPDIRLIISLKGRQLTAESSFTPTSPPRPHISVWQRSESLRNVLRCDTASRVGRDSTAAAGGVPNHHQHQ